MANRDASADLHLTQTVAYHVGIGRYIMTDRTKFVWFAEPEIAEWVKEHAGKTDLKFAAIMRRALRLYRAQQEGGKENGEEQT